MHTGVEAEGFGLSSRVATGFFQFGHDVVQRGQARCGRYIPADVDVAALVGTVDKLRYGAPAIGCHAFDDGVTFGMYGRGVKRIASVGQAQETGTLFECCGTEAGNFP